MIRPAKIIILTTCLIPFILSTSACADDTANKALDKTHGKITKTYEAVRHINSEALSSFDEESYLIFDVRERDEFAVSHIENSIWVDPSIDAASFYEKYAEQIGDKALVLYCSVGVRSSRLAEKLMTSGGPENSSKIYNLENGIFGWHNESRPLVVNSNATDYVHPYNFVWGRMVNRKDLKRYKRDTE